MTGQLSHQLRIETGIVHINGGNGMSRLISVEIDALRCWRQQRLQA